MRDCQREKSDNTQVRRLPPYGCLSAGAVQPLNQRDPGSRCLTPFFALPKLKRMEVQFTPDQKAFARDAIESGRLRHEEDAVREALSMWEGRERARAEILAAVDEAEASLARDESWVIHEQSVRELSEGVKKRGRARLAAEEQIVRR